MTHIRSKGRGQLSLDSKVRLETDRRTNGRTEAIALLPALARSVTRHTHNAVGLCGRDHTINTVNNKLRYNHSKRRIIGSYITTSISANADGPRDRRCLTQNRPYRTAHVVCLSSICSSVILSDDVCAVLTCLPWTWPVVKLCSFFSICSI